MIVLILGDSIDPPGNPALKNITKVALQDVTFINNAAYEHGEEDKESGFLKTIKNNLYSSVVDIDYSDPSFLLLVFHPGITANFFESISSDLPSPPPKVK